MTDVDSGAIAMQRCQGGQHIAFCLTSKHGAASVDENLVPELSRCGAVGLVVDGRLSVCRRLVSRDGGRCGGALSDACLVEVGRCTAQV